MSGSFESVRWNACVHELDLSLCFHPKEFSGNGVRTHVNSKEKIPSTRNILLRGGPNPRRCKQQDSEPNTLPTELFLPLWLLIPAVLSTKDPHWLSCLASDYRRIYADSSRWNRPAHVLLLVCHSLSYRILTLEQAPTRDELCGNLEVLRTATFMQATVSYT